MKVRDVISKPLISNGDEVNDPPRPFMEHIVALRDCLIHSVLAWAICCIVAGVFSPSVLNWLRMPAEALEKAGRFQIQGLDLTSGFSAIISIAMWGGTALSFPFLMYFILRFVFPALTKREKAGLLFFLFTGAACFGVGVWMAYTQLAPNVVAFFDVVNRWVNLPVTVARIENYVSVVLKLILAFGLVFQIPLALFFLGWMGVISSDSLRSFRRFAIVIAFVLGMVLTPPDPMSQLMMALPLCILYELCIWGVWLKEKASSLGSSKHPTEGEKLASAPDAGKAAAPAAPKTKQPSKKKAGKKK